MCVYIYIFRKGNTGQNKTGFMIYGLVAFVWARGDQRIINLRNK